jgi:hypothetical protein
VRSEQALYAGIGAFSCVTGVTVSINLYERPKAARNQPVNSSGRSLIARCEDRFSRSLIDEVERELIGEVDIAMLFDATSCAYQQAVRN